MLHGKKVFAFATSLVMTCIQVACVHRSPSKPVSEPKKSEAFDKLEDEKIPMELWSPSKRKANASYYFLVAEYEAMERNAPRARRLFENAYNLDPNPFLGVKLIEAKANEDIDQAIGLAKKMVLLYPGNPNIHLLYGRLLSGTGDLVRASSHLQRSIQLDPQNVEAHIYMAQILQFQKKPKEAIPFVLKIVQINPDLADGWVQLSKLYLQIGQYKKAYDAGKRAYELNGTDPDKVHLLAVTADLDGNTKHAASLYDELLSLDPTNEELVGRMLSTYAILGDPNQAIKRLTDLEKKAGREVLGIQLMKALLLWDSQKFEEGTNILEKIAEQLPQSERLGYITGLGLEKTKQYDKALEKFRNIDNSSELFLASRFRMIEILKVLNRVDEAIAECQSIIEQGSPKAIDFYPILANLFTSQKKYKESLSLLDSGYSKYPDRSDFLFLRAVNLERMQRFDESTAALKELIKVNPQNAAALNYLGYMYAERGVNLTDAEFYIKKALEIKPDDGYYLDSLGWVYFKKGNFKLALDTLLKANELVGNEAVILEHIADCYEALGDRQAQLRFLEKALKARGDEADKIRIQKKYEEISK